MEDAGVEEEVKPFAQDDHVKEEEDVEPDPDEMLNMDQGNGRVWIVKVPKHLMERWSAINEDGVQLGTVRVYEKDPKTGVQRVALLVPPESTEDSDGEEEYHLDLVNDSVENQFVIAEREKAPGSRARTTILTGLVKHDCNVRPVMNEKYRKRMRERHRVANTPARQTRFIEDATPNGRGAINRLSSGLASTAFSNLVKTKQKPPKGSFERFARMPKNQLLDMLFALYRERERWAAKDLRMRTEQPEAYLKEVLAEIADLHRSGEYNGLYELKPNFKENMKAEYGAHSGLPPNALNVSSLEFGDAIMDDQDEDDDDDDDDMEEVS